MPKKINIEHVTKIDKKQKEDTFIASKHLGFMIPTTDSEVKLYESLYGTTDIEMPDDLKDPDQVLNWGKKEYFKKKSIVHAMAAREGQNLDNNDIERMKQIHDKALKEKQKKDLLNVKVKGTKGTGNRKNR